MEPDVFFEKWTGQLKKVPSIFEMDYAFLKEIFLAYKPKGFYSLCAETRMLGKTGMDICIGSENGLTFFTGPKGEIAWREIKGILQSIADVPQIYLEMDTSSNSSDEFSFFLKSNEKDDFLSSFLNSVDESKRLLGITDFLNRVSDFFCVYHIGYFKSRNTKPLRLVLARKRSCEETIAFIQREINENYGQFAQAIYDRIKNLPMPMKLWNFDFDENGNLCPYIGIEAYIDKWNRNDQIELLQTNEFLELTQYAINQHMADDRMKELHTAISAKDGISNRLSHLKFSIRDNRLEPLKVYFGTFKNPF